MKKFIFSLVVLMLCVTHASAERVIRVYLDKPGDYPDATVFKVTYVDTDEKFYESIYGEYGEIIIPEEVERIKVVEFDVDRHYYRDSSNTIYYFDFSVNPNYSEIHHSLVLKDITLNLKFQYYSWRLNDFVGSFVPNFTLYDENGEFLEDITQERLVLQAGNYILKDNDYNVIYNFDFTDNEAEITFAQYLFDGITSETQITSFCDKTRCYDYTSLENTIYFAESLIPGKYLINNKEVFLDGNTPGSVIDDLNILYLGDVLKEDEEEKYPTSEDKPTDDKIDKVETIVNPVDKTPTISEDESYITVDVPNTGLEVSEIIYYVKKDYII